MMVFYPDERRKVAYSREAIRETDKGRRGIVFIVASAFLAASVIPFLALSALGGFLVGYPFRWAAFGGVSMFLLIMLVFSVVRYASLIKNWRGSRRDERIVVDNGFLIYSWKGAFLSQGDLQTFPPRVGSRKAFGANLSRCNVYIDLQRQCLVFAGDVRAAEYESIDGNITYDKLYPVESGEIYIPNYFESSFGQVMAPLVHYETAYGS